MNDHVPLVATNVLSSVAGEVELSYTTTVDPASAVPAIVGETSFVMIGEVPVITGAFGAAVSIARERDVLAAFPFPAASLKTPESTATDPVTWLRPAVGVKVNLYTVGDTTTKFETDPSVVAMSVLTKLAEDSLSVAVTTAV